MEIPFNILIVSFMSIMLFFPVVFFSVFIDQLGSALGQYAEQVDRTGARMLGLPRNSTTSEGAWQATVEAFTPVLWIVPVVSGIILMMWISWSRVDLKSYYLYRLRAFSSSVRRAVALLLFATFTVSLYSIVAVAGGIILYGITGVYYLPAWTLELPLTQLLPELSTSVDGSLLALYRTLDYVFADTPVLHARLWSLVYLTVLLWPFVFAAVGTVGEILGAPYRALRTLHRSTPLSAEFQSLVAEDIQVRRINCGGHPDLRPLSVLFGRRKYILVSDVVVKKCPEKELKALLRHEQYHLEEWRLGFGARVLSSVLGGANLLPAFYDFRKSEREADAAAADVVGKEPLRHAIIRLYDIRAQSGSNPIGVRYPSAIGNDTVLDDFLEPDTQVTDVVGSLRIILRSYLLAPYRLYFGGVLLNTAHMNKRERLAALRDN
ncbi:hypothetical protein [Halorubrum ezzemoulense]|uniref:hypothetical protein n=1 Tax=Halorubrum ezzemoulense TaxID=337243 RepID=UPI002330611C|nr:hypothetical protein [Halorubrum ezzemoulense]